MLIMRKVYSTGPRTDEQKRIARLLRVKLRNANGAPLNAAAFSGAVRYNGRGALSQSWSRG